MLRAKVRYFTTLHELARSAEEELEIDEGSVLADLIEKVASRYGKEARNYLYYDDGKVDPSIYFLINGVNSRMLSGPETKLRDGDVVAIIPPIGGGQSFYRFQKRVSSV